MQFFSISNFGFYNLEFHEVIPEDSVKISDEDYDSLMEGQSQGKLIVANDHGYPVLQDPPPPTAEFLAAVERVWRNAQLTATDGVVSRHRDEVEEAAGTTLTADQYVDLQAYRRALRGWPESGEFPLIDHRPPAPGWLAAQVQ